MRVQSEKIDDNASLITVSPDKKELAYFNGKEWEYKGTRYKDFKDIPL